MEIVASRATDNVLQKALFRVINKAINQRMKYYKPAYNAAATE